MTIKLPGLHFFNKIRIHKKKQLLIIEWKWKKKWVIKIMFIETSNIAKK